MTRRIALAILTIVWLLLLTAGVSTYFLARSILLADLDDTILGRIASMPEIERPSALPSLSSDARDRFVIQYADNRKITANSAQGARDVPAPEIVTAIFTTVGDLPVRTLTVRAYARRAQPGDPLIPVTVIYSAAADHVDQLLRNLIISLAGFGLLAAVGTAAVARSVAKVAMRPMLDTADVIGAIDEKTLDRRIDVARLPAELAPMGRRLNDMLARLETAFSQHRQFLADASHELRTPVAAMVTTLEVALRRKRDADEYQRVLESCLTDAHQLQQLVVALLDQVRAQRFSSELDLAPAPVTEVLRHCAQLARTLAAAKNITIDEDIADHLVLLTDEQKLRSIVTNLLSNAVEYTQAGGRVRLAARLAPLAPGTAPVELPPATRAALPDSGNVATAPRRLILHVQDDGPGIAAQHLPHLFEPFYRADRARTHPEHHLGLGLSIVRGALHALGGVCNVQSPPPAPPPAAFSSSNSPPSKWTPAPHPKQSRFYRPSRLPPPPPHRPNLPRLSDRYSPQARLESSTIFRAFMHF